MIGTIWKFYKCIYEDSRVFMLSFNVYNYIF